ncbi:MAG: serine hydrolase domain-containing protein [Lysobacterales bacterium]
MNKLLARLSIIVVLQLACFPAFAADSMRQMTNDYEIFFRQLIKDRNYPGAAFAIVSRDQILHIGTAGHRTAARKHPIDEQTTFRLASVSKPFAAELVGILVEDGTLNWEDPVTHYVPGFKINGDASQIRIRHLLGQSTGLMPHAYDNLLEDGKSMASIWKKMNDLPYVCKPGKCYGYQNSVFSLVEPVVMKATNQDYSTLVEQRIFKPLDMTTASVGFDAFINNPNHAKPHARRQGQWKTVPVQPNYYRAAPAAGVNASILDMGKFVQAQLGSKPEVLSPQMIGNLSKPRVKTRRELYRKQWKTMLSEAHYGLGWRIYQLGDEQLVYHGGWVSGFRADVAFSLAHNIGIVVLLNAESSGISELTTRFWQMALAP